MKLTQKILKELLHYDQETGVFTWLERDIKWFNCNDPKYAKTWNNRFANNTAGCYNNDTEYLQILIFGKKYYAHRLAFLYMNGEFPNNDIDHKDQDRKNCSFDNLLIADAFMNQKNATMKSTNKSGFNGVHFDNGAGKWRVRITVDNKKIHGGLFDNIEDAINKRKQMNIQYGFSENHGRKIR